MFAYTITTYCDKSCDDPECILNPPKKTLLMLHLDPMSEEEQALAKEILERCIPLMEDEEDVLDLHLDGEATNDAFHSLKGIFSMVGTCHRILKESREAEEYEFKEDSIDVDLNI